MNSAAAYVATNGRRKSDLEDGVPLKILSTVQHNERASQISKTRAALSIQRMMRGYRIRKRATFFVKLERAESVLDDLEELVFGYQHLFLYAPYLLVWPC